MFNSVAFDVVIGLVFVYLLYSLLGTLIQEIIATNIGLRGWVLQKAIRRMLDDDDERNHKRKQRKLTEDLKKISEFLKKETPSDACKKQLEEKMDQIHKAKDRLHEEHINAKCGVANKKFSDAFYAHPLIKYMAADTLLLKKMPSYIDPETFSKVVIDLLRGQNISAGASDRQSIQKSLDDKKVAWEKDVPIEQETLTYLKSIWADAQGDVTKFTANLEQWFNEMMDRATGWYKKYTQLILLLVGLAIAGAFNVDTIRITNQLEKDPKLREQVVSQASNYIKAHPEIDKEIEATNQKFNASTNLKEKDSIKSQLVQDSLTKKLGDTLYKKATTLVGTDIKTLNQTLSMGWSGTSKQNFGWLSIPGWLLTALAISLGAPFWFDLLNKLMQLKSAVAPKDDAKSKSDPVVTPVKRVG